MAFAAGVTVSLHSKLGSCYQYCDLSGLIGLEPLRFGSQMQRHTHSELPDVPDHKHLVNWRYTCLKSTTYMSVLFCLPETRLTALNMLTNISPSKNSTLFAAAQGVGPCTGLQDSCL